MNRKIVSHPKKYWHIPAISLPLEANEDDVTQAVTDLNDAANALRDLTKSTKRKSSASADPKAKSKGKKAKKA